MSQPPEGEPLSLPPLLAIVGPTASGKTGFALRVARRSGAEIISCDSMAVYKGLDIGTDKPSAADRAAVPHHLLDVVEPGDHYSAGDFRVAALEAIRGISLRKHPCIIVGGTGLYFRGLTRGLLDLPPRQKALRERLDARVARNGPAALHRVLTRLDPDAAARISPRDTLRTVRALEVRLATGQPLSRWINASPFQAAGFPGMLQIGITAPREILYSRIEARAEAMLAAGLLSEVEHLWREGRLSGPARKAIGYGELADHLEGRCSLEEALARIKLRSRHLAKRQLTWFKKETGIRWYNSDKEAWENDAIEFIQRWNQEAQPVARDQHTEPDPELRAQGPRAHHHLSGKR
jgi:tRNA dimethylallyltransferase